MKIFLICPVNGMTGQDELDIGFYVATLKADGHQVHWPPVDTDQNDPIGFRICCDNTRAIILNKTTNIIWKESSIGSKFDFGATFCLKILGEMLESGELTSEELIELLKGRSIDVINPEEVEEMVQEENKKGIGKSFNKVVLEIHKRNSAKEGNNGQNQ
jgi:hypothetical protein